MNKSYRKGYKFQRRTKKWLEEKGWNVIIQPRSLFPDIIAWTVCKDAKDSPIYGKKIYTNTKETQNSPFYDVVAIECKVNKYLTKEEKEKAAELLSKLTVSHFFIAHRKGYKLLFYEPLALVPYIKNEDSKRYIG